MAANDPSTHPPADAPPSVADVPTRPRFLRIFVQLLILVGLFAAAVVASWQIRVHTAGSTEAAELETPPIKAVPKKIERGGNAADMLVRGDQSLSNHQFAHALSHYSELLDEASMSVPLVEYRIGLCNESLGQFEKAVAFYRKALKSSSSPRLAFACSLAVSRCLLMKNNAIEARQVLYPFLLNESKQQGMPGAFVVEARHLVALALARGTHPVTTNRLELDQLASFTEAAFVATQYLEETAEALPPPKEVAVVAPPKPIVIQKRTEGKPAHAQLVRQFAQPTNEVFKNLATGAGWRVEWTAAAKKMGVDRLLDLNVDNWPLLELIELAADHLDLSCQLDGDLLRFSTRAERDAQKAIALNAVAAHRALQAAITADSSHPLAASVMLELGNRQAGDGKFREAMGWYERLIREEPSSPCVILAYFNRAQIHLRQQSFLQARRDYYRAIDQAPSHEFAVRAHLRLGQFAYEEENTHEAIPHFRRAQILSPGSPCHPLATLNLAAALISQGQSDQAQAALQQQRAALVQAPFKTTAAFLDAYASFKLSKGTKLPRRASSDLLAVMWQNNETSLLGPLGQNLMAQAYHELGFADQAERQLRQALASVHQKTSLAAHLELKIGESLLSQDQFDKARSLFEKVAATSFSHRYQASFHLARLDLREKKWGKCNERCRALWESRSFSDSAALLQVWGTALESMGNYAGAAQCFAGSPPQ